MENLFNYFNQWAVEIMFTLISVITIVIIWRYIWQIRNGVKDGLYSKDKKDRISQMVFAIIYGILLLFVVVGLWIVPSIISHKFEYDKVKTTYTFNKVSIKIETIEGKDKLVRNYNNIIDMYNISDTTQFYVVTTYSVYGNKLHTFLSEKSEIKTYGKRFVHINR